MLNGKRVCVQTLCILQCKTGVSAQVLSDVECVEKLLPEKAVIIITDNNVFNLYADRFPACPVLRLEPGEKIKQLSTIGYLAEELLKAGIDRSGFILGIGGGVICDITGFLTA